ncbi:MAG: cytochrome c-type biogenesis protein CcmH [Rubrivivax sp.]|nr:cytochrome c-type biogenesis protein CcmH [Rubrivivax sp.]
MHKLLLALLALCLAGVVHAADAPLAAAEPELEKQMLRISAELRCLVCQNQTIADSNAELAVDLRRQVREMLRAGQSERQIIDYMTARYGDFVLYRPPVKGTTFLLWFGPAVLMVVGLATLVLVLRRRSRLGNEHFDPEEPEDIAAAPAPLDPNR